MGELIYIEDYQSMDTRIRVMRKLFRANHGSFLEQLPNEEKLRRDGQDLTLDSKKLWAQDDDSIDKLARLALNTAKSIKDEKGDA